MLCLLERRVAQPGRVEQEREQRALRRVAGDREGERREQLGVVLVDRRVDQLPGVLERRAAGSAPRAGAGPRRAGRGSGQRLDREPALVGPLARRDAVPGGEGGVEPPRVVDAEVGEPRPDARLVDDSVAEVAGGELDVRLQRRLDELGSAFAQAIPVSTPTCPRSTSPKRPARPAICASSHGSRSRRASPSNFVVSAKSSVSQGRLTPWPSTSVATVTSDAPPRKRSISSRRELSGIAP